MVTVKDSPGFILIQDSLPPHSLDDCRNLFQVKDFKFLVHLNLLFNCKILYILNKFQDNLANMEKEGMLILAFKGQCSWVGYCNSAVECAPRSQRVLGSDPQGLLL